jgi:CheY-like chemotaxis protein
VVRVTVRDTGIGIEPEALERIFDAFEQVRHDGEGEAPLVRQFGGLGLGLAICRTLAEQHRGSIRALSDGKGRGSTFVIDLPAVPQAAGATAGPRDRPSGRDRVRPLRLLLVEDHADTASVLTRLLSAAGHAVKSAGTAADALRLAGEHTFDIMLSDLGLPDMTGYDLMREIRRRHPLQGIAMSGYGMDEDVRKSQQAGFSDHLTKPVSFAQLQHAIRRVAQKGATPATATAPSATAGPSAAR